MTDDVSADDPTPTHAPSLTDLARDSTRSAGHAPLLTWYDDLTGARTELSYATLDNWAAKTANLLSEELDVGPGTSVALDLDGHWTAAVLTLACWKVGAALRLPADPSAADPPPDVVCCHDSRADAHPDGRLIVVGDGFAAEPLSPVAERDGLILLGETVHAFADDYDAVDVTAATPALVRGTASADHATVFARAQAWAAALGDAPRVGLALALDHPRVPDLLAGVLRARGSLVAVRAATHPAPGHWSTERVTVVVGADDDRGGAPQGVPTVGIDTVDAAL